MQRLYPLQNGQFGSKIQNAKNIRKTILQEQHSCSVQKTARKSTNIGKKNNFENRPSTKGYSPCKGYSLCKMVSLGQKFKKPKTYEKPFYKNSTVVLCKKRLEKAQILERKTILRIDHLPKAIAHAKAIAFAKWSVWVKN